MLRDPSLRALLSCLVVGAVCAALSLAAPLHAVGADTVPGRLGAAVFACRSTVDLREVDWIAAKDDSATLPYFAARGRDGAVVSVFGPGPAVLGAPFMEGLEEGAIVTDLELERRARQGAALAVSLAALLLAAALCARTTPLRAAGLALATSLSFAGAATMGQGLWPQTAVIVPLMAAVATLAWAAWRGGALLAVTPGLLAVSALARPNAAFLVGALAITWVLAVRPLPRRRALVAVAVPLAIVLALPQLAWNVAHTGDPLALRAYVASHTGAGAVFHLTPGWWAAGVAGLVASPARGLALYAPLVLLAVYAALRYGDASARALGVGIVLHVAVVAAYRQWWGGWVFGPRMLVEAVWLAPLLVASIPPSRAWRVAVRAAASVAIAVGVLGTFRYDGEWDALRDPDAHPDALWDVVGSPIATMLHPRSLTIVDAPQGPYAYCGAHRALVTLRRVSSP